MLVAPRGITDPSPVCPVNRLDCVAGDLTPQLGRPRTKPSPGDLMPTKRCTSRAEGLYGEN